MTQAATTPMPRTSPLDDLHKANDGHMVSYAGWSLPVRYGQGIIAEHQACRSKAVLFDVSHMGQLRLSGPDAPKALETLVPGGIASLKTGQARYTMLTNEAGGIIDDIIVANLGEVLSVVVNGACREADIAHLRKNLEPIVQVEELADRALLALQGPAAGGVMAELAPQSAELTFMQTAAMDVGGVPCRVSRMGYTGEDGFEISVPSDAALDIARSILADDAVIPAGLGARDSLRLEAGLCLYGNDIDRTTTPIEAQLSWTIPKRRREEDGFPGADVIRSQLKDGADRLLVGIRPDGRAPARDKTEIQDLDGNTIGIVTSGVFGPSIDGPIAMGYVAASYAQPDTEVALLVRGKARSARIATLPFVPHRYRR